MSVPLRMLHDVASLHGLETGVRMFKDGKGYVWMSTTYGEPEPFYLQREFHAISEIGDAITGIVVELARVTKKETT